MKIAKTILYAQVTMADPFRLYWRCFPSKFCNVSVFRGLKLLMAVRLKDIARDLGVSLITVSKALRGMHPDPHRCQGPLRQLK
jgi:hypothetical protein